MAYDFSSRGSVTVLDSEGAIVGVGVLADGKLNLELISGFADFATLTYIDEDGIRVSLEVMVGAGGSVTLSDTLEDLGVVFDDGTTVEVEFDEEISFDSAEQAAEEAQAIANDATEEAQEEANSAREEAEEEADSAAQEAQEEADDAAKEAQEEADDAAEEARAAAEEAKSAAKQAKDDTKNDVKQAKDDTKNDVKQAKDDAKSAAKQAKDDAKDTAKQAKDDARNGDIGEESND